MCIRKPFVLSFILFCILFACVKNFGTPNCNHGAHGASFELCVYKKLYNHFSMKLNSCKFQFHTEMII